MDKSWNESWNLGQKSWNLGHFLKTLDIFCKVCKMRHQSLANYRTKQKMPLKSVHML